MCSRIKLFSHKTKSNNYNKFPRAEMLNLLLNGGGDGRRRVFMVPSVQALSLKNACCCPGLLCNSVSNLNMFMNTAVTCRMKIIVNCHGCPVK